MFGVYRPCLDNQRISDRDHIPIKSGIPGVKFLKSAPKHIMDAEDFEPLYVPQENIMEDCLRREAERVANQDILTNKICYDSQEAEPGKSSVDESKE